MIEFRLKLKIELETHQLYSTLQATPGEADEYYSAAESRESRHSRESRSYSRTSSGLDSTILARELESLSGAGRDSVYESVEGDDNHSPIG